MWKCSEEKTFLDFPYLQVVERQCRKSTEPADSEPHRFYVIRAKDWCNIIPVTDDGKIVLIRQFRAGVLDSTYEFPGGVMESSDSNLQATALREMTEETGYEPLPGAHCQHLGSSHPNPALQDNFVHSLVVGPVKKTRPQNLDPMEDIEVLEVSVDDLAEMLRAGKITHALMLTTLFHLLLRDPASSRVLAQGLASFQKTSV